MKPETWTCQRCTDAHPIEDVYILTTGCLADPVNLILCLRKVALNAHPGFLGNFPKP